MALSTATQVHRSCIGRLIAVVLAVAAVAGSSGCRSEPATPEEALRQFIRDVGGRRTKEAWAALSTGTRQELERRAKELAAARGEKAEVDPARILYEDLELTALRPAESVSVASRLGSEVTVRVSVEGGETANIKMVREGTRWKVDLLSSLKPLEAPGGTRTGTVTGTTTAPAPG